MIIIDKALEKRQQAGNPVRVAMIGAGFMGRGIALQTVGVVPGMNLVAISNRHVDGARRELFLKLCKGQIVTQMSQIKLQCEFCRKRDKRARPWCLPRGQKRKILSERRGAP